MLANLQHTAAYFVILTGFALPVSTAGVNISLALTVLLMLPVIFRRYLSLTSNTVVISALALWLWFALAVSYSQAEWGDALQNLKKYIELLYLPVMMLVFQQKHWQRLGIHSFMLAIVLVTLGSYFVWLTGIPVGDASADNPMIFKHHITHGILLCVSVVLLYWYWRTYWRWRWLVVIVLLLILYNLLFISQSRTAYVILSCLVLWAGFRWLHWRGLLFGMLAVSVLLLAAYTFSDSTRLRLQETWNGLQQLHSEQALELEASTAYRLEFIKYSVQMVPEYVLFGTGTGGFVPAYAAFTADKNAIPCENPHNEYLLILLQWGIPGILLFLGFLAILIYESRKLGEFRLPAQGLLVIIIVGNVFNSLWLDFTEGYTFAYFIALFYASTLHKLGTENNSLSP
jgi:O-antigen ligase